MVSIAVPIATVVAVAAVFAISLNFGLLPSLACCLLVAYLMAVAIAPYRVGISLWIFSATLGSLIQVGPTTLDQLGLAAATAALAWAVARGELKFGATPSLSLIAWPAVAILVAAIANQGAGLSTFLRLVLIAFVTSTLTDLTPRQKRTLRGTTIAGLWAVSLSVLQQRVTNWPAPYQSLEGVGLRYGGLVGHPNFAAYVLGVGLVTHLFWARRVRDYALFPVILVAMVSTGSRSAVAGAVVVTLISAVLWRRRQFAWLLIGGVLSIPFAVSLISRLESISETGGIRGANASGWRFEQWARAWKLGVDSRVFGIGWRRSEDLLPQHLGVHNLYLEVLVELGIVGAILFALGLWFFARRLNTPAQWMPFIYVLGVSISDPVLIYPAVVTVFIAIILAQGHTDPEEKTAMASQDANRLSRAEIMTEGRTTTTTTAVSSRVNALAPRQQSHLLTRIP